MEEHFMPIHKGWNDAPAVAIHLSCFLFLAVVPAARAQQVPVHEAASSGARSQAQQKQTVDAQNAPVFRVDPFWPKPLPNRWSMQQVTGLYVEAKNDHIWFLNRGAAADGDEIGGADNPPRIDCCVRGPEVIELDQEGNVVNSWGGPGYIPEWPIQLQTIIADRQGNIWIGGTAPQDSILKFSRDGKLLWDFGHRPPKDSGPLKENNQQTDIIGSKGRFNLDEDAREIYMVTSKRVLVFDMDTGAFKRGWGGHGMPLSEISNDPIPPYTWTGGPPPEEKQFVPDLHFAEISKDKLVYVGERGQDRIEVFTTDGKFVKEFYVSPNTPSRGEDCGGLPPKTKMPPCGTTYVPTTTSGFWIATVARLLGRSAAMANTRANSTGSTPSGWTRRGTFTRAKWSRPRGSRSSRP